MKFLRNISRIGVIWATFMLPTLLLQAQSWENIVGLKDRRGKNGADEVKVGSFTLHATYTTDKVGRGTDIPANATVDFGRKPEAYIKVYISDLKWIDPTFTEGDRNWKVVFNPTWLNVTPKIWDKEADKKKVMIGYYTEYSDQSGAPPPIIFTVSNSGDYTFRLGYKILTPQTTKEKPNYVDFSFSLRNIGKKDPAAKVEEKKVVVAPPTTNPEDELSDADLEKSIQDLVDKGDLKGLKKLMAKFPNRRPVIDAAIFFEIQMGQELIQDSSKISTNYRYFPQEQASPSEVIITAKIGDREVPADSVGKWHKGVFIAHTRMKYTLQAAHIISPKNKSKIEIDPSVGKLALFAYKDTLDSAFIHFHIKGGGPPYRLFFFQKKKRQILPIDKPFIIYSKDTIVNKFAIANRLRIQDEGDFSITLFDKIGQKAVGTHLVFIAPPPLIPDWLKIAILIATFVIIIAAIIVRRQQRKRDEEMDKSLAVMRSKPTMRQKPELNLGLIFKESAISLVMLNDEFIQDVEAYLRDRKAKPASKDSDLVEGLVMGRIMKFDHNTEQFHLQLERFERMKVSKTADFYHDRHDEDAWPELREIEERNPELQRIGWLQTAGGNTMSFSNAEQQFHEEQFPELYQLAMKIDADAANNTVVFLSRSLSGKMNNPRSIRVDAAWGTWEELKGE
ncbi:MAG: hypothetical protein H6581_16230 [Bacteroidia bacterium]|nr:hypothetical protein [Bacteroidia bacterium]